jgi:hypothetical protein
MVSDDRSTRILSFHQVVERSNVIRSGILSGKFGTPQDSLKGTQAMMHGRLTSRRKTSSHCRVSRATESFVKR